MTTRLGTYWKLLVWSLCKATKGRLPVVGESAPPFAVADESGVVRVLEEFRGRTLVLWFYPLAGTPG